MYTHDRSVFQCRGLLRRDFYSRPRKTNVSLQCSQGLDDTLVSGRLGRYRRRQYGHLSS